MINLDSRGRINPRAQIACDLIGLTPATFVRCVFCGRFWTKDREKEGNHTQACRLMRSVSYHYNRLVKSSYTALKYAKLVSPACRLALLLRTQETRKITEKRAAECSTCVDHFGCST
jgi:hypothetical protein